MHSASSIHDIDFKEMLQNPFQSILLFWSTNLQSACMSFPKEGIVPISMLDTLTRLVVEIKKNKNSLFFFKKRKKPNIYNKIFQFCF